MDQKRSWRGLLLVAAVGVLGVAGEAHAIIGRPLTPMSYAGVARRSVRRSALVAPAVVGAAAVGAAAVARPVLPAGCVAYAPCGGVVYQPAYSGPTVVYVPR